MSEPIELVCLGIYKYMVQENGKDAERTGTGLLELRCGSVRLYSWHVRPRKTWWGTTCNHEDAVIVTPAEAMMSNVEKTYKYEYCMDIFQGYDLLAAMGVPTNQYVKMAKEQGWGELVEYDKERRQ
jgi:hypothetical protein